MYKIKNLIVILIIILMTIQPLFSQYGYYTGGAVSYEPFTYSGVESPKPYYQGIAYEPFYVNGTEVFPISYGGTYIDGEYYEGIELSEIKITILKLTGNEKVDDFYNNDVDEVYKSCWSKVISKFAIGTTIIVITGVLTLFTGGTAGYICAGAFVGSLSGAASGAAIGGLIQGSISALDGNPLEQVFYDTVSGASDGYMWGAITGAITGATTSATQIQGEYTLINSKGKIAAIVDNRGIVKNPRSGKEIGELGAGGIIYSRNGAIAGVIDDSDGLIGLGDNGLAILNRQWESVKNNPTIYELSDPLIYTGNGQPSKILGNNYQRATGIQKPKASADHHIVSWNHRDAKRSREILEYYNIDVNDAINCAVLPSGSEAQATALQMTYHPRMHTREYYQKVQGLLENCQSRDDVIFVLDSIRSALYSNSFI